MENNKKFITSTLPYANSQAHVGHAFEFVLADVLARYYRLVLGKSNVLFNTGIDEHGQKIFQASQAAGMDPQSFCNSMHKKWIEFCELFYISYDNFYRTTSDDHVTNATKFVEQIKDFYYLKDYTGFYCHGCEAFKTEREIVNDHCPDHITLDLENISEQNLFLKLKQILSQNIIPDNILVDTTRKNELKNFIENSEDISMSRQNGSFGIDFPGYPDQTIYVWQEALMNYPFAAGYKPGEPLTEEFKEWWENALIICGPDNLRFQAMILPALLAAGNLPVTHKVMVHGSIQDIEGKKMSKSTGNGIDPVEQVEKYGINAVRYYLCVGLNTFDNSNYLEADLIHKWNNDIVKGYGNLMARVLHLIDLKQSEIADHLILQDDKSLVNGLIQQVKDCFDACEIKDAYNTLKYMITWGDKYISDSKPYGKECENPDQILNGLYYMLYEVSKYYKIIFPNMDYEITDALKNKKKVILFKPIEHAEQVI